MTAAKGTSRGIYAEEFADGLIQMTVRLKAGHQCEQCGIRFGIGSNRALVKKNAVGVPIIGTVHHIDMDPQNSDMSNLVYLCQTCHCQVHGVKWEPGRQIPLTWKGNVPKWIIERGLPYIDHPQLSLFVFEGV
jgi:hypothetical protein